jgi:hypothetical protein
MAALPTCGIQVKVDGEGGEGSGTFSIIDVISTDGYGNEVALNFFAGQCFTSREQILDMVLETAGANSALKVVTWNVGTNCNINKASSLIDKDVFEFLWVLDPLPSIIFLQELDSAAAAAFYAYFQSNYEEDNLRYEHHDDCAIFWNLTLDVDESENKDRICGAVLQCAAGSLLIGSYHSRRDVPSRQAFFNQINGLAGQHDLGVLGGDANAYAAEVAQLMPQCPPQGNITQSTSVTARNRGAIDHVGARQFHNVNYDVARVNDNVGCVTILEDHGMSFKTHRMAQFCRLIPDHHCVVMDLKMNKGVNWNVDIEIVDDTGCEIQYGGLVTLQYVLSTYCRSLRPFHT